MQTIKTLKSGYYRFSLNMASATASAVAQITGGTIQRLAQHMSRCWADPRLHQAAVDHIVCGFPTRRYYEVSLMVALDALR